MWQHMSGAVCLKVALSCCVLQESLGGRVRVMVTGAAPISPTVLNFLRAALGCQVLKPVSPSLYCLHPSPPTVDLTSNPLADL